ncbi:pentatricopeptide repeat-containing protein At5g67570, chloroplastic-like [Vicia villosa]|uniref:pentatricopeptide repeat-containing protein At5g67570, chloroplastic-like n=1 Tax=Vicia villosa TaxID=3911 RepID=UPI00273CE2E4|nr:pentatricopeptide repeat-containing protein At5g67570, chloroplastic-like [Vicia villosa]
MEALHIHGHTLSLRPRSQFQPNTDQIRLNLIKKGVNPTPKIVHTLRKKQIQKHNRKLNREAQESPPLSKTQKQTLEEEQHFQELKDEYKQFTKALEGNSEENKGLSLVGKPWEGVQKVEFLERTREFRGEKLKRENLTELKEIFSARKMDELKWVLEDDLEIKELWFDKGSDGKKTSKRSEVQVVSFLVDRLCDREIGAKDWKFSRLMKLSGLPFTEGQLLKILGMLDARACWKQALSVVQWVYDCKERKKFQSRFVYTKLLAVLGKARRPKEALQIFNLMRGNIHVYPDMVAYHSIAVTLGQAGLLKELLDIVECMRQKPETFNYMYHKNWDPILEPDVVIYNAVLNACVPSKQWKGVSWVFQQLRESGLKPNGATYGLAMEVMLQSGNYDLVHELFRKMTSSGEVPEALTYKVLVRTFWKEGKVDEAVKIVRDMERRGVMGTASVYYELACCLCKYGRWQDAIPEVEKIRRIPRARPVEVTFTGMIKSSMDGGHIDDCVSIFEYMKDRCAPNIGTVNTMLKVYSQNDMFSKAKVLFEEVKVANSDLRPDAYTYNLMLEASARAHQWEYFEHVYKEMILSNYHLDQYKHLALLLKASRAGKLHLLEHAFDMILEAGEIPHRPFFFELVIQAMTRDNYDRAVVLLRTMAYAPYRVTEKQWTGLFKENEDRINHENLELLLNSLGNCTVTSEATVSNLSKALHVLCGLGSSTNTSSSGHFGSENVNGLKETAGSAAEPGNDIFLGSDQAEPDAFTFNHDEVDRVNNNDVVVSRLQNSDTEDNVSLHVDRLNSFDHLTRDKSSNDELSDDESDEDDDDVGEGVIDKPSAYQILEAWKENERGG